MGVERASERRRRKGERTAEEEKKAKAAPGLRRTRRSKTKERPLSRSRLRPGLRLFPRCMAHSLNRSSLFNSREKRRWVLRKRDRESALGPNAIRAERLAIPMLAAGEKKREQLVFPFPGTSQPRFSSHLVAQGEIPDGSFHPREQTRKRELASSGAQGAKSSQRETFRSIIVLSAILSYRSGGAAAPAPTPAPRAARRPRASLPSREGIAVALFFFSAFQKEIEVLLLDQSEGEKKREKNEKKIIFLSLSPWSLLLLSTPTSSLVPVYKETIHKSVIRDPLICPPHLPGAERPQCFWKNLVLRGQHPPRERRGVIAGVQNGDSSLRQDSPSVECLVDEMHRGPRESSPRG